MYRLMTLIIIVLLLGACTGQNAQIVEIESTESTNGDEVSATLPIKDKNTPIYLNEMNYKGDELEIVKLLNRYIKALYNNDFDEVYRITGMKVDQLPGVILEVKSLDFAVKPDFALLEGSKPVVVEYVERIKISNEKAGKITISFEVDQERQLFVFRKEYDEWKLDSKHDWW